MALVAVGAGPGLTATRIANPPSTAALPRGQRMASRIAETVVSSVTELGLLRVQALDAAVPIVAADLYNRAQVR